MTYCDTCEATVTANRKHGCSLGVGKIGWVDYCPNCDTELGRAL